MAKSNKKHSILECLEDIGITSVEVFGECSNIDDEFGIVKKSYHGRILATHPDKGGDAEEFRVIRASFEILRNIYKNNRVKNGTFTQYFQENGNNNTMADNYDEIYNEFDDDSDEIPSYDFFREAAEEEMPGYVVEPAKSSRSQCLKCKPKSAKGKRTNTATNADSNALISTMTTETALPAAAAAAASTRTATTKMMTMTATTTLSTDVVKPKKYIGKGEIRVGSLDDKSGSYGRWHHLTCWRVPSRVWSGLTEPTNSDIVLRDLIRMDEVLLTGIAELDDEQTDLFVQHVMNKSHWAAKYNYENKKSAKPLVHPNPPPPASSNRKKHSRQVEVESSAGSNNKSNKRPRRDSDGANEENNPVNGSDKPEPASASSSNSNNALISTKQHFVIPRPGIDGAIADILKGKKVVLTGTFPEVGGGRGLNLGKDKMTNMIVSFGGQVTKSISGKTNYLVVGKAPGASKVGKAREKGIQMMNLNSLQKLLLGQTNFDEVDKQPPPTIQSYSEGYKYMLTM